MREIIIRESESGQKLHKFLQRYLSGAGAGFLYKMLRKKNILLNRKKASGEERLSAGDAVQIYFSEETLRKFSSVMPEKTSMPEEYIIYEDGQVLFLNKPAGILSQKAAAEDVSMVELMRGYLLAKGELTEESMRIYAPGVLNRLDRNTSGLLLAAKTLSASRELSAALRRRTIKKTYLTLAAGRIKKEEHIRAWLGKDSARNTVKVVNTEEAGTVPIETAYRPVAVSEETGDFPVCTLLEVDLITGRSHQIRAHLAHIGHPVAGDAKYGDRNVNRLFAERFSLRSQFLHAYSLTMPAMPDTFAAISNRTFRAPLPGNYLRILAGCGIQYSEKARD